MMRQPKRRCPLWLSFVLLTGVSLFVSGPSAAQLATAQGRACLVVEESPREGEAFPPQPRLFNQDSAPGPGNRLALYLDSSVDAYALVAVFNDRDRQLTNGWRPELVQLKAREEAHLPSGPVAWEWNSETGPFEFYVIFLTPQFEGLESLKTLVSAIRKEGADSKLLGMQTQKLYEEINRLLAGRDSQAFRAGTAPSAWGGTLRGAKFPWRQMAQAAVFDSGGRGILIYRYES